MRGQVGSIDHFLLKSVISQPIVGLASVIKVISDVGYFEMIFFATALYLVSSFLNYYVRPILHYWQNWQLTLLDIASSLLSLAIGLGVFTFISGS